MTLRELGIALGEAAGHGRAADYTAVAMAIKRFEQRAKHDKALSSAMQALVLTSTNATTSTDGCPVSLFSHFAPKPPTPA